MILQALSRYYDILIQNPESGVAPTGYSTVGVSFALVLSPIGELKAVIPLFKLDARGKEVALRMNVPERAIRSSGVCPNFLVDNAAYVLGISEKDKDKPSYALQRFLAFRETNLNLLREVECPESLAVMAFLQSWDPARARTHPMVAERLEDLIKASNLVFKLDGTAGYIHEAQQIRRAWENCKTSTTSDLTGQCLITGEVTSIARLHPNLKGVRDTNPSGASLVGFNAPAYESYHREQGMNAQTGEKAAFAYTTALNFLLSKDSPNPKFYLGDTTVVYWAESPNRGYSDLFSVLIDPDWYIRQEKTTQPDGAAEQRLREIAHKVRAGEPLDTGHLIKGLDPDTRFYVLGLAPNVARVSVRFFHCDPFVKLVARIMEHYKDLEIDQEFPNDPVRIPIWQIFNETVSQKSHTKQAAPLLAGAVMRSILEDTPYPASLFYSIINRIRADTDDPKLHVRKIGYIRAAIIKAYLTRKYRAFHNSPIQEVIVMSLNEQSTHPAYLFGRLFAVLEKAQEEAIQNINATIKDRFFSSACASPVTVFPRLLRLSNHHLAKLTPGRKVMFEKLFAQIMGSLEMNQHPFPAHLSLDDQGAFVLGYYHQRSAFFEKKTGSTTVDESETTPETN